MTTNAVLLDKYMDYIVEQDISLLISLDGDKKASSYRTLKSGRQSYDRVYSNIRELKKRHFDFMLRMYLLMPFYMIKMNYRHYCIFIITN